MDNNLTDREFWLNYWESKTGLITKIDLKNYFTPLFKEVMNKYKVKSAIEIGGFPGYQTLYLNLKYDVKSTLLDYIIHKEKIAELIEFNGIANDSINLIETDFFNYDPKEKYDLVFSIGFIEHFRDTKEQLELHAKYLNENGTLLIIVPNFLGINGWMNKNFDKENFDKHYLECMDKNHLESLTNEIGLNVKSSEYYGGFSIWLENYSSHSGLFKFMFKTVWAVGKVFSKVFRMETKLMSPYTVLVATK